jgi:hypothetical protein
MCKKIAGEQRHVSCGLGCNKLLPILFPLLCFVAKFITALGEKFPSLVMA